MGFSCDYNVGSSDGDNNQVSYARNLSNNGGARDGTLDRSYEYDQVGRLTISHSGTEARAAIGAAQWGTQDGPYSQGYSYDQWGNITGRQGWGGWNPSYANAGFNSKNQMTVNPGSGWAMQYDAAGNMTFDGAQSFTYDATGSQVQAPSYGVWQGHDGDGLRVKNAENGAITYYILSTMLGGQVVADIGDYGGGNYGWTRGYVYAGGQVVAIQENATVYWAHQDPINKSQRITDAAGSVVGAIEVDPWGANTSRSSSSSAFQPHQISGYTKDGNGDQDAMARRYSISGRFSQPDPYLGG